MYVSNAPGSQSLDELENQKIKSKILAPIS